MAAQFDVWLRPPLPFGVPSAIDEVAVGRDLGHRRRVRVTVLRTGSVSPDEDRIFFAAAQIGGSVDRALFDARISVRLHGHFVRAAAAGSDGSWFGGSAGPRSRATRSARGRPATGLALTARPLAAGASMRSSAAASGSRRAPERGAASSSACPRHHSSSSRPCSRYRPWRRPLRTRQRARATNRRSPAVSAHHGRLSR